jgi:hypothetical protein
MGAEPLGAGRAGKEEGPHQQAFLSGRYWARTSDPQLVERAGAVAAYGRIGAKTPVAP